MFSFYWICLMKVLERINARKIVLGFFYQYLFFDKIKNDHRMMKEVLSLENIFPSQEDFSDEIQKFVKILLDYKNMESESELVYAIKHFFDRWKEEDIDMDYLFSMGKWVVKYSEDIVFLVNKYAKSFSYEKMDLIDQTIFLLGYVEWKVLETPKEVLLNEMIELSKRYADDGTAKLVNGIMHNILANSE